MRRIRYIEGPLFCVKSKHIVQKGDEGIEVGPLTAPLGVATDRQWFLTLTTDAKGNEHSCPVTDTLFEYID
jgi:hypothetical protein